MKKRVKVRRKGRVVHVRKSVTEQVPEKLTMPTKLVGQNGAVIKQTTVIAVSGCPPTVAITKTKLKGNALLVTVKTSTKSTVTISGNGLRTKTVKNLKAGTAHDPAGADAQGQVAAQPPSQDEGAREADRRKAGGREGYDRAAVSGAPEPWCPCRQERPARVSWA